MEAPGRLTLLDATAVHRTLERMAREIVEKNEGVEDLVLMGVRRRGVELARKIREVLETQEGSRILFGAIDITLYRDDLERKGPLPLIGDSELPLQGVEGKRVVVVDDVLHTGRTARAAMNELMDWGRPDRILLCVLIEREGRELPIQADIVGRRLGLFPNQRVEVLVPEEDGRWAVELSDAAPGKGGDA
jgi:pyrimidine operon attenuation protein / uracil phosphoribosyltransferase